MPPSTRTCAGSSLQGTETPHPWGHDMGLMWQWCRAWASFSTAVRPLRSTRGHQKRKELGQAERQNGRLVVVVAGNTMNLLTGV